VWLTCPATVLDAATPNAKTPSATAYDLRDQRQSGDLARVKLTFGVKGTLEGERPQSTLDQSKEQAASRSAQAPTAEESQAYRVPMSAVSRILYDERALVPGQQAARVYRHCDADLAVGDQQLKREVDKTHRMVLCYHSQSTTTFQSAGGPMTREELDILQPHGNSLIVYGLLPTTPSTKIGDNWPAAADTLAPLLNLDGIDTSDVSLELREVQQGLATITILGDLQGYADGATSKIQLKGELRYDLNWRRISWCHLMVHEQREACVIGPGLNVNAELKMLIEPVRAAVPELADAQLNQWMRRLSAASSLIAVDGTRLGLTWCQDPNWHLMLEQPSGFIVRYVPDGEVIAQCNVSQLPRLAAGKELSLEDFQQEVRKALGARFSQFAVARQEEREDKCRVLRVDVVGSVDDVPIHWIHYNLQSASGDRAGLVFTMKEEDLERFGEVDQAIIKTFQFVPVTESSAAQQTAKRATTSRK
jgi:hypothetical protein